MEQELLQQILVELKDLKKGQDSLEKGQASLNDKVESLAKGQASLNDKVESLAKGQASLEKGQASLENGQLSLNDKIDSIRKDMNTRFDKLETKVEVIYQHVGTLTEFKVETNQRLTAVEGGRK